MDDVSVIAITKNGVKIGENLKSFSRIENFCTRKIFKWIQKIIWYSNPTSEKIIELFQNSNALICIFSLGAVIRLIAPHLKDKKTGSCSNCY